MLNSKVMQALSDSNRQKILELLKKKDLPVSEIAKDFNITLPSLSHHLSKLKNAGLVTANRQGQEIYYSLNLSAFEQALKQIIKFLK